MSATAATADLAMAATTPANDWLRPLRRYMACVALANLAWKFAHMPLYMLFSEWLNIEFLYDGVVFARVYYTQVQ